MRHDDKPHRPWQRKAPSQTVDPLEVFRELGRRVLTDPERCRVAWEEAGDPLAVCVAVTQADLPEWLVDGLLFLLMYDGGKNGGKLLRRAWRERRQNEIDAVRASNVAQCRAHPEAPQTWAYSYALAELMSHEDHDHVPHVREDPSADGGAIKKSYQRVTRGLRNPGRYYRAPGFDGRYRASMLRTRETMQRQVESRAIRESGERKPR